jgi:hypothetical protein
MAARSVERVVAGQPASDGAGVRLLRVLTQDLQRRLDPFLMLDEFRSDDPGDYIAGFPSHPHRGFQTVTVMLAGRMRHRDNAGHEGLLGPGGVQWMNAARGIVHSELPEQQDGLMHGFQFWLNLPAAHKMDPPDYRDIPAAQIPERATPEGVSMRVIAGTSGGVAGAVNQPWTEPLMLDMRLPAGSRHVEPLPAGHNAFAYVYEGEVAIGEPPARVDARRMAILGNDAQAHSVSLSSDTGARLLLVAGRPLREPIAQWGPFVMNTRQQLIRAVEDFEGGRF